MKRLRASRYLGMNPLLGWLAHLLGKDAEVSLGLDLAAADGTPLLTPFCPPWFPSMEAAVRAVVDLKFGPSGVFRGGVGASAWRDPERIARAARTPGSAAVDAAIAYCDYVHRRYGRFPAYPPPFRTILGYQTGHLDLDFYDRHYRPEALSATQREHMGRWHRGR